MAFQATKRSVRTSTVLRSWGVICFLMRDWFLDTLEPCLLVLEVALDRVALSFIVATEVLFEK